MCSHLEPVQIAHSLCREHAVVSKSLLRNVVANLPFKVGLSIRYERNRLGCTLENNMLKTRNLSFYVMDCHHLPALLMRVFQWSKSLMKHYYIPCEEVFLFHRLHYFLCCMYANRLCLDNCVAVPGCLVYFHLLLLVLLHSFSFLILNPFFQGKITLKKAAVSKFVFVVSIRPLRSGKLMPVCVVFSFWFFISMVQLFLYSCSSENEN